MTYRARPHMLSQPLRVSASALTLALVSGCGGEFSVTDPGGNENGEDKSTTGGSSNGGEMSTGGSNGGGTTDSGNGGNGGGVSTGGGSTDSCDDDADSSCDDDNPCTTDRCVSGSCGHAVVVGEFCDGGVCSESGSCIRCLDSETTGVDRGCHDEAPFCTETDGVPHCTACLSAADCGDGNACTDDVCTDGTCSNPVTADWVELLENQELQTTAGWISKYNSAALNMPFGPPPMGWTVEKDTPVLQLGGTQDSVWEFYQLIQIPAEAVELRGTVHTGVLAPADTSLEERFIVGFWDDETTQPVSTQLQNWLSGSDTDFEESAATWHLSDDLGNYVGGEALQFGFYAVNDDSTPNTKYVAHSLSLQARCQ